MKVIVEHDESIKHYLGQYSTHHEIFSGKHISLEIEEKYLTWLQELTVYVEPLFSIKLRKQKKFFDCSSFYTTPVILGMIGPSIDREKVRIIYDMNSHKVQYLSRQEEQIACDVISCCSAADAIDSRQYIKCIDYLTNLSKELNKPVIIYADIEIPDESCRYRTLAYKIVNGYISQVNGIVIIKANKKEVYKYYNPVPKAFEFYLDHTIYLEEEAGDAVKMVMPFLYPEGNAQRAKKVYRVHGRADTLYHDVFYKSIPDEEEIYVIIGSGDIKPSCYYEALGFTAVKLFSDYCMLYGTKKQFDAASQLLSSDVVPQYQKAILTPGASSQKQAGQKPIFSLVPDNLKYKGEGVYIGVVTADDVDYTHEALRLPNGESRIDLIWQQQRADSGISFTKEQIDGAINSPHPNEIISLPEENSLSTMILGIAGGLNKDRSYRGIATQSKFIAAKIKCAGKTLQHIYGGMPSSSGVLLPDIIIGALKLAEFAMLHKNPLALCIPFNTNVDSHDGSLILQQILSFLARRMGLTLVIPSGEEGDKMHHYGIVREQKPVTEITLRWKNQDKISLALSIKSFQMLLG